MDPERSRDPFHPRPPFVATPSFGSAPATGRGAPLPQAAGDRHRRGPGGGRRFGGVGRGALVERLWRGEFPRSHQLHGSFMEGLGGAQNIHLQDPNFNTVPL